MLLTLFLSREPTTCAETLRYVPETTRKDVVMYRDKAKTQPCGRWHWWQSGKPTRRNRYVMFNCYKWRAVWV